MNMIMGKVSYCAMKALIESCSFVLQRFHSNLIFEIFLFARYRYAIDDV